MVVETSRASISDDYFQPRLSRATEMSTHYYGPEAIRGRGRLERFALLARFRQCLSCSVCADGTTRCKKQPCDIGSAASRWIIEMRTRSAAYDRRARELFYPGRRIGKAGERKDGTFVNLLDCFLVWLRRQGKQAQICSGNQSFQAVRSKRP
jgi:hypothetical protein